MRSGEARRLDRDHLDWDEGVLMVWDSKFQKSRALPLHPTTMEAPRSYAQLRDELCPHPNAPSFFITTTGNRLGRSFNKVFAGLVRSAGLDYSGRRPRPHDLRHRFAVRTMIEWHRAGVNVDAHMPLLSTYLGHSNPENTFSVSLRRPRTAAPRITAPGASGTAPAVTALAPTLEAFFTERLMRQRQASPNTVAAYRDGWRLLLGFATSRSGKQPSELEVADLDAP